MTSTKDHRLVRLVACIALGHWSVLSELRRAAPADEPDQEWREAFLMTHLFAGFPRTVEAALVLNKAGGLGQPTAQEQEEATDPESAGRALFQTIYSNQTEAVAAAIHSAHPLLESWILGHAYGRVLARPGLSAARRELLAVAALAALGQMRQLGSHVRGALRCGALPSQINAALESIADLIAPQNVVSAQEVIQRICAATESSSEELG